MSNPEFQALNPFEKTVLLEIARAQAFASSAFQMASAKPGEVVPPAKQILDQALADSMSGILSTLKKNQR